MKKHSVCLIFAGLLFLLLIPAVAFAGGQKDKGPEKEVELTFPTFWVGQDSKSAPIQTLVDRFNEENAGKIRVVIEPNPDTDGYRSKINSGLAAGVVPDIFVFNPDPTTFGYYESDLLMDFTDDLTGDWAKSFADGYIQASTMNGVVKSIPFEIGVTPIWYNEDLFKKAGINGFPKTFDEFWAAADKLKAAGIVPTSQMTGGANAWTSMLWYSHILASLGGPTVWERPLTDPIYVKAAEILLKLYTDGNTTKDAVGGDAGVAGGHYMAGNTAIFINGPWYIGRIKGDAPAVHAATRLAYAPAVSGGKYGAMIGFQLSNLAAGNTDDPVKRAAVIKFMKFLTDPENVSMISQASGAMFALKYEMGEDVDPLLKQFIEISSQASFSVPHFQSQYRIEVVQELGQAIGAMVLGKATPEEFVQMLIDVNQ
ncbi:MAG: extracellular solute-binding protein [Spirochaetales bacterium]|nr:extracellular solute-binding protein [Spirochaetales bacterium]